MTATETTLRQVWLARCWTCGWQVTYMRQPYAKGALTKHVKRCPQATPSSTRSWWKP
jgi:hypothetical protein